MVLGSDKYAMAVRALITALSQDWRSCPNYSPSCYDLGPFSITRVGAQPYTRNFLSEHKFGL